MPNVSHKISWQMAMNSNQFIFFVARFATGFSENSKNKIAIAIWTFVSIFFLLEIMNCDIVAAISAAIFRFFSKINPTVPFIEDRTELMARWIYIFITGQTTETIGSRGNYGMQYLHTCDKLLIDSIHCAVRTTFASIVCKMKLPGVASTQNVTIPNAIRQYWSDCVITCMHLRSRLARADDAGAIVLTFQQTNRNQSPELT